VKPPSTSSPLAIAIAIAVGPAEVEVERLRDLADSIVHHDRGPATLVLVDDSPQPRQLDQRLPLPPPFRAVSLHHPRQQGRVTFSRGKGICSAILLALQWTARNLDVPFVLKLDTDSLVISPFRDRLATFFGSRADVGMVGAYTLTPNGTARDWSVHGKAVAMLGRRFDWRWPLQSLRATRDPNRLHVARLIRKACANGYEHGEHCMGGGYALSGELVRRMDQNGYLDAPDRWMHIDLPEDVMIGIHVRAVGMAFANHVGEGEVFGVRYLGLPDSPQNLLAKRYAVIHAVKNDPNHDEATIRAFFKADRERAARPG
jgi:hypothetical protein